MNEPIVIDTPEGIEHFRIAAIISALRIEVKTGMKMSRMSALAAARQYVDARTKRDALAKLEALYEELYGWAYGSR